MRAVCGAKAGEAVSTRGVAPSATTSPVAITTTRSAAAAANSTSWVETTTAFPSAASPSRMATRACLAA